MTKLSSKFSKLQETVTDVSAQNSELVERLKYLEDRNSVLERRLWLVENRAESKYSWIESEMHEQHHRDVVL